MSFRRVLTAAALVLAAVVLVGQVRRLLADPTVWPPDDFIEYWAAAKLALAGANPYDPAELLPLQRANGRDTAEAVMMWNPPWALAVVLPLGLFPAREAQLIWLAVNLAAVGFCGDRLWRVFGGRAERRWVGWAVVLAALPTAFALQSGQIGPVLLLGAVLFLECERRGYDYLAGGSTVLLAIKPHLAYLVWAAILCDAVARGRWRIVLGGAVAGLACAAVPLAFNPHVWSQYLDAMGNRPPAQWVSPTLGTVLRLAFGEERFGLQFVPMIAGLAWFAVHWRAHRRDWNWTEQLPLLLLVSFVTAPYGAWPFDMVLLLPAAMQMVANPGRISRAHPGSESSPSPLAGEGGCEPREQSGEGFSVRGHPSPGSVCWRIPNHPLPQGERAKAAAGSAGGPQYARGRWVLPALVAVNVGCLVLNLLTVSSFWFLWVSPAVLLVYTLSAPYPVARARGSPTWVPA